jgi:hypothetical protein
MHPVKWQDDDGGWHTGRIVIVQGARIFSASQATNQPAGGVQVLVKESCCGTLTWVDTRRLEHWPRRSEWDR